MDEQLNVFVIDEGYELEIKEDVVEINAEEDSPQGIASEITTDIVEVEAIEEIEISMEESIGWVSGDSANHYSLNGRDDANQHTIGAITGLRKELDSIKNLQTVYSDKKQQADYYKWYDENASMANRDGLFVSIYPDTDYLCICDGIKDVFGVTVADAGFIGGQLYQNIVKTYTDVSGEFSLKQKLDAEIHKYGLVAHSGLVSVRRESTVTVGDYVVPNGSGVAQKSNGNYGYLVVDVSEVGDVKYAIISLATPSTLAKTIADNVDDLGDRMNTAEYNITSVTNVANSAYAVAQDAKEKADASGEYVEGEIANIAGRVDAAEDVVGNLSESVSSASQAAALAKVIAEGAVSSAEAIRSEAVTKANQALDAATTTRKEVETRITQINTELDNTNLELQATKEGIESTIDDLKLETEGQLADFQKEVRDNYATTTQLAAVKTESSDAVAALRTEVSDTYATQEMLTAYENETSKAITDFKQEVEDDYATQEMLSSLETDTAKALADYKQEVTGTYATQEMVSTLKTDTTKALTDYKQEVTSTYATQEMVSNLETETSKALADYKQEVEDNYATQEMLTTLETDTSKALTDYKQEVTNTYATQEMLTTFEGTTNSAMATLQQKADANGASIEALVANVDKYAVGEYSQAYGLTLEQAKNILQEDTTIYVPTVKHSETYTGDTSLTKEFNIGYFYIWNGEGWDDSTSTAVNHSSTYIQGTAATPYWLVTVADVVHESVTYDLGGLYKWESDAWVKVASVADNTLSRAVSAIKQTADSISVEVTNVKGDVASHQQWLDNNGANIQSVVTWKSTVEEDVSNIATIRQTANDAGASIAQVVEAVGEDGEVNAASIVTAINDDTSGVTIEADHINLRGKVTVESLSSETKQGLVSSTQVLYARSNSATEFVAVDGEAGEWSTTAPVWVAGEYMWQKTIITYVNGTTNEVETCIQGASGRDGQEVMSCRIESSAGASFKRDESGSTTLTARLYRGATEIDADGEYEYTWCAKSKDGTETTLGTGKSLEVQRNDIVGKSVYFTADNGDGITGTSILGLAYLGVMTLGSH